MLPVPTVIRFSRHIISPCTVSKINDRLSRKLDWQKTDPANTAHAVSNHSRELLFKKLSILFDLPANI
jgi:hypothetical protein